MPGSDKQPNQLTTWINGHYAIVSRLLFGLTILAFGVALHGFFLWRYDLLIDFACQVAPTDYSQSDFCLDSHGLEGWALAFSEAAPYAGGTMLILICIVYVCFGKQLDLKNKRSVRRDTLKWVVGMSCLFVIVPLFMWLVVYLIT